MTAVTEHSVREALTQVIDPEMLISIIDLGLVYAIVIEPDGELARVRIEMTMTSPACPIGPELLGNARTVVAALPGVGEVDVKMVMSPPWTPDRMTEEAKDQLGIF